MFKNNYKFNLKFLKPRIINIINYKMKLKNKIQIQRNYNKILKN